MGSPFLFSASSKYSIFQDDFLEITIMLMKSIFSHIKIKLLTGLYIITKLLIELSAHFWYAIKAYW